MRNFKQASILGLILVFSSVLLAQPNFVKQIQITKEDAKVAVSAFKAVSFKFPKQLEDRLEVEVAGKLFQLSVDEHINTDDGFLRSRLFVFDQMQTELQLMGLTESDTIIGFLIASPAIALPTIITKNSKEDCDSPPIIPQEVWRKGLPDPDYTRIPNEVNHQIIHHSASQNDLTDYTNLVRSIYLYHTEVNGWSDIGYNYLIAPDGSVYAGRDAGENLSQDDVLGAHFCGSNNSTMGICMLGTFSDFTPTTQALQALEQLLVWKSAKEILDPLAHLAHPLNQNLGTIAGHRDGCATLCPGDSLYALLPLLRQKTLDQLHGCGVYPFIPESQTMTQQLQLFPNPATKIGFTLKSVSEIQEVTLYSIDGKQLRKWMVNQKEITLSAANLQMGSVFLLKIRLANQQLIARKLIISPF
ncbi:MAG: N-acetylmuramoyl-L-alanine amidase [Bacteroidales bacterium]|nr:N-acetylmuramoyl-L-alanine amidase [Bacteroidales bacterium]